MATIHTTITVDFVLDPGAPSYGAVWEDIGRSAPAFFLVGTRGEKAGLKVVKFFATESEALDFLADLDALRDGGYPFALEDAAQAVRYELFLHGHNDPRPMPIVASDGSSYVLELTLTVTRLSNLRQ